MTDLEYAYDAAGRLTSATYPDGTVVSYGAGAAVSVPAVVAVAFAEQKRFCTACGAPGAADDRFCLQCGAPLG